MKHLKRSGHNLRAENGLINLEFDDKIRLIDGHHRLLVIINDLKKRGIEISYHEKPVGIFNFQITGPGGVLFGMPNADFAAGINIAIQDAMRFVRAPDYALAKKETINKDRAKDWLSRTEHPRALLPSAVSKLKEDMEAGKYDLTREESAISINKDSDTVLDGLHRLQAFVNSNLSDFEFVILYK